VRAFTVDCTVWQGWGWAGEKGRQPGSKPPGVAAALGLLSLRARGRPGH